MMSETFGQLVPIKKTWPVVRSSPPILSSLLAKGPSSLDTSSLSLLRNNSSSCLLMDSVSISGKIVRRVGLSTCSAQAGRPCPAPTGSPRATATPSPPHDVEQLALRGAARGLPQERCGRCRTQQPKKKNIIVRIFFLKMHTYLFTQRLRLSCSNFSSGFDPPWLRVKRNIQYEQDRYNHKAVFQHSWFPFIVSFS